jgi:hypothetical protein
MSEVVSGIYFVWERGLSSLSPAVYHDGYPKHKEKVFAYKIRITEQEAKLPIADLVKRYPLERISYG